MQVPAPALTPGAPSTAQLNTFAVLSVIYMAITAAVMPFAAQAGPSDPRIVLAYGAGILAADLSTALLLGVLYRASGRGALLVLLSAYLYGALMAAAHVALFPGALSPGGLFPANAQAVSWLFLAWRIGTAVLFLLAVWYAGRSEPEGKTRLAARILAVCLLTLAAGAVMVSAALNLRIDVGGERLAELTGQVQWVAIGLHVLAFALIWYKRAFNDVLFLWVGLVLVASIADLTLSNMGGTQYTIGWHASRASFVVSACLLLAFLLSDVANRGPRMTPLSMAAAYGGAIAVTMAAAFLRWFLDPWLGHTAPFATLYGAIAISVWFGGFGPAVLATVLGYLIMNARYLAPTGRFGISDPPDAIALILFALSCAIIIVLGEAMRRARDRYRISEMELKQKADALQRADTKKSEFLAVLSHELRNPLAPLRTGLALLKMKGIDPAAAETHAMMERQISQLARLIDDLLDVSRIDRGKLEMRTERVSLQSIIKSSVDTARPNIDAQGHSLEVRQPLAPLYVQGDPVRLAQVISNLLNNAAKFTPPGGRIQLTATEENRRIVLRVVDSGIGIAPERLGEVFDMFVQLDTSKGSSGGGLGLGLTLARSIVQRHGGTLDAHSAGPGKGAEFVVRLPQAAAPVAQPAPAANDAPHERRRVLVVDDNVDAAQTLAEYLRLDGHRVESALDGEQALRVAEVLQPDVAFIDLNMPRMDGAEVARRLRLTPWGRKARLIALTGMGQQSDVQRTREAGFDDHITKPADLQRISRLASGAGRRSGQAA